MRKPSAAQADAPTTPPTAGVGAPPKLNLAIPQMVAAYDQTVDQRKPILSVAEMKVFVDAFTKSGFTGGINWYRNWTRNWQRAAGLDHTVRVPSLMIMAENDLVLPPSAADGRQSPSGSCFEPLLALYYFFLGTFFPFLWALERAMAIACFRLFTLPAFPALPLFAFPRL